MIISLGFMLLLFSSVQVALSFRRLGAFRGEAELFQPPSNDLDLVMRHQVGERFH
jgi:hypothetical protein